MARSGDVLEHPVTGEKIVVRKTAGDTQGELYQADIYVRPRGFVAAEHIHPLQDEHFEVISGTLSGRIAGRELIGSRGVKLVVPAGQPHVWWNSGDEELHVLCELRPALRTEEFFESFFGLAQDGHVDPRTGLPNLLRMAVLLRAHRNEVILARPSPLMQTLLFGPLAFVGRLLGYKPEHPYPWPRQTQERSQAA